eukprot:superscaffoldBa00006412_g21506
MRVSCGQPTVVLPTESPHGLPCGIAYAGPTAALPFGATMIVSRGISEGQPTVGPVTGMKCGACVGPTLWGPHSAQSVGLVWALAGPTVGPQHAPVGPAHCGPHYRCEIRGTCGPGWCPSGTAHTQLKVWAECGLWLGPLWARNMPQWAQVSCVGPTGAHNGPKRTGM